MGPPKRPRCQIMPSILLQSRGLCLGPSSQRRWRILRRKRRTKPPSRWNRPWNRTPPWKRPSTAKASNRRVWTRKTAGNRPPKIISHRNTPTIPLGPGSRTPYFHRPTLWRARVEGVLHLPIFIAPGVYMVERNGAVPFIACTAGLFIAGGLFAYFVAFRYGLAFLLGIGGFAGVVPMVSIDRYFSLFVNVILGVALVFELPVLI